MSELNTLKELVKDILEDNVSARNSDYILYELVLKEKHPDALQVPTWYMLEHHADMRLTSFESVRRSRQKVQAENEHLRASDRVRVARLLEEGKYKEFALN